MKTISFRLPIYWSSALINGDFSGCDEQETGRINAFLLRANTIEKIGACLTTENEETFSKMHDAWIECPLGGGTAEFIFPIPSPSLPFQTSDRLLRTCYFTPYRPGHGPRFHLKIWDTYQRSGGKNMLAYTLEQREPGHEPILLFDGADFCCAPGDSIDSDACVENLMGFLTLKPGDTDKGYFANYTEKQKEFCSSHAETLSMEVRTRFCDENGNVKRRNSR